MAYGKRNYRKRKGNKKFKRKNKNSNRNSKLSDKKINTLVEVRMQEIAQSEDRKNQTWLKPRNLISDPTFNWATHGSVLRVPAASCLTVNAGTLWHLRLTDFGQLLQNDTNNATGSTARLSNYIRCMYLKSKFDFRYTGSVPQHIRVWMVQINASQELAEEITMPDINTVPKGGLNDYNYFQHNALRELLPYKYKILCHTDLYFRPSMEYTSAWPINNNNSTVWNQPIHMEQSKSLTLNKFYKGLGKKLQVNHDDPRTPKQEIFLCACSDGVMTFTCVTECKIRVDSIQDRLQPSFVVGE